MELPQASGQYEGGKAQGHSAHLAQLPCQRCALQPLCDTRLNGQRCERAQGSDGSLAEFVELGRGQRSGRESGNAAHSETGIEPVQKCSVRPDDGHHVAVWLRDLVLCHQEIEDRHLQIVEGDLLVLRGVCPNGHQRDALAP